MTKTEILDKESSSGATPQSGSPGETQKKTPDIKSVLKFPHSASQEVETSSHPGPTASTPGGTASGQSSRAAGTAQARVPPWLWAPNPSPSPPHFLLKILDNGHGRVGTSCIHTNPQGSSVRGSLQNTCAFTGARESTAKKRQAGPSPSLGPTLCPGEGARQEPRNVGAPVLTPWEERLSSPRPRAGGWKPARQTGMLGRLLWPQGRNRLTAGPHLGSLPGQGTGRGTGLVCPRTGREELRSQRPCREAQP